MTTRELFYVGVGLLVLWFLFFRKRRPGFGIGGGYGSQNPYGAPPYVTPQTVQTQPQDQTAAIVQATGQGLGALLGGIGSIVGASGSLSQGGSPPYGGGDAYSYDPNAGDPYAQNY